MFMCSYMLKRTIQCDTWVAIKGEKVLIFDLVQAYQTWLYGPKNWSELFTSLAMESWSQMIEIIKSNGKKQEYKAKKRGKSQGKTTWYVEQERTHSAMSQKQGISKYLIHSDKRPELLHKSFWVGAYCFNICCKDQPKDLWFLPFSG